MASRDATRVGFTGHSLGIVVPLYKRNLDSADIGANLKNLLLTVVCAGDAKF